MSIHSVRIFTENADQKYFIFLSCVTKHKKDRHKVIPIHAIVASRAGQTPFSGLSRVDMLQAGRNIFTVFIENINRLSQKQQRNS